MKILDSSEKNLAYVIKKEDINKEKILLLIMTKSFNLPHLIYKKEQ